MVFLAPALFLLLGGADPDDVPAQIRKFMEVYATVEREAADPLSPPQAIYGGAIPGMLRRLDPHSVFFDPDQFAQLKELQTSTRKGFGSVVSVLPGRVIVLQTLPGTPAAKSGLAPGDEIVAVNGIGLARLDLDQLIGLLSESRQNPARLEVRRPGNARLLPFTLTPAELQAPSVERAFLLRPGVGYLRVASFDAETGKQVRDAIEKLGGSQLHGLVLDLRNNPGGLLPAGLETASLFVKPGAKLLTVRGRTVTSKDEKAPEKGEPYGFPVAVLINGKTASAAEIVAGALQDHDRAVIVGEPSFGKGLVESVYSLTENTGLALTTAYYYTPSGRSIQKPLEGSQIRQSDIAGRSDRQEQFRTDSGRSVRGGGGIQPDYVVYPETMSQFRIVLDASGAFTSFATEYMQRHGAIDEKFQATPAVLDEFQAYLAQRSILPGVNEWLGERDWISNRLKTEMFNQALGVERGDEVEAQRDPVILAALDKLATPVAANVPE
jgi:carboxyl-terminal processing protease